MPRPRVLFVSAVPDFKGGAEVVLRTMLANPHVDPVLAVPEEGPVAEAARAMGVPVCTYHPGAMLRVRRPPRPGPVLLAVADALRCALRLRRLARAHGCAIVHGNGLKPNMLCVLLGLFGGPRTLIHLHDIAYRASERAIWTAMARCVDQVVAVSRPCYPGPTLPANVRVVLNSVAMLRNALPPAHGRPPLRLGFAGRFHPNKGMDYLLDWFTAVRRAGIEATLTIRGRPDPDLPEYWQRIAARIRDEGLAPFVQVDGWVTGTATYDGLDVLLVTSNIPDPGPLVAMEAMSAGVVVAGFPRGGLPYTVEDGRTGLLVEDGETLAHRLRTLLDEPGSFERMRLAAHGHVRAAFSTDQFHASMRDVYQAMLAPPRAGRGRPPRRAPEHGPASGVAGHGG